MSFRAPSLAQALLVVALVVALTLPLFASAYYLQFASKVLITGVLAMGLNLAVGQGGMVSLCHGAFFGGAGYILALASPGYDAAPLLTTLPLAVIGSAALAFLIGCFALRTRGVYFIMVTLAFGEMLFYLFHDSGIAGGSDGAFINARPEILIAGRQWFSLDKPLAFYFVMLALTVVVAGLLTMLARSPFGHALAAVRDNERRARSLGFPIFRIRLSAFVISGALAGLAGYFAAAQFGFVAPQMLSWHVSAAALVMVLIGGLRSVTGPLIGALVLTGLEEVLKAEFENWKLIEGLIVILLVIVLAGGLRQLGFLTTSAQREEVAPASGAGHA